MALRSRAVWPGLLVLQCATTACGAGDGSTPSQPFSARDSAGIDIIDIVRPQWDEGAGWRVSAQPTLEIGAVEGDEAYQLYRVTHAIRLAGGSIVVANRGTQELRWFGPDGGFLRSAGGEGEGPGEFNSLFALRVFRDTIWAHDFPLARMTAFDTAGSLLRTVILDRESSLPTEIWPVGGGFVAHVMETTFDITADLTYHRRTVTYWRYAGDGSVVRSIDTLPGLEFLIRGGPVGGNTFVSTSTSPLIGHTSQQTVVGDRLVTGITDRFELRVFGTDGRLERLIRDPARDLPVTDAEWKSVFDQAMQDAETAEQRRSVQSIAELRPAPETRPAFGRFVGDPLGFVWIEPYRPAAGLPVPWLVVNIESGAVMGTVDLPERFRPTDFGADYVLGVARDELDVEHVQLYALDRSV